MSELDATDTARVKARFIREGLLSLRKVTAKRTDTDFRLWKLSIIDALLAGEFAEKETDGGKVTT